VAAVVVVGVVGAVVVIGAAVIMRLTRTAVAVSRVIVAAVAMVAMVVTGVSVLVAMATVAVLGVRFACHFVPVATRGRTTCGMALPIRKYKSSGLAHCV
jgi:hypothetical protein